MPSPSPSPSPTKILEAQLLLAKAESAKKKKAGTASKSKRGAKGSENHSGVEADGKKKRSITITWSKAECHPLTDTLLTLIEDNPTFKVAFGFDKGDAGSVPTGGKKASAHHEKIARKLFIDVADSKYTEADIKPLQDVVRNRINTLKATYQRSHKKLTATGQGLIDEGREAEITPGSQLDENWSKIQKDFPWYKRMHALMGTSPVVDRAAVANSTSEVDLSVLGCRTQGPDDTQDEDQHLKAGGRQSPPWPEDDDDDDLTRSPLRSPRSRSTTPPRPVKKPTLSAAGHSAPAPHSPATPLTGQKRKGLHDVLAKVAEDEREGRFKMVKLFRDGKEEREKMRNDAAFRLETLRQEFAAEQAAKAREHELAMITRQIELERLRQHSLGQGPPVPDSNLIHHDFH